MIPRTLTGTTGSFNVRTDVNARGCARTCTDTRKRVRAESWLREKNPLPHRGIEPAGLGGVPVRRSTNWASFPPWWEINNRGVSRDRHTIHAFCQACSDSVGCNVKPLIHYHCVRHDRPIYGLRRHYRTICRVLSPSWRYFQRYVFDRNVACFILVIHFQQWSQSLFAPVANVCFIPLSYDCIGWWKEL